LEHILDPGERLCIFFFPHAHNQAYKLAPICVANGKKADKHPGYEEVLSAMKQIESTKTVKRICTLLTGMWKKIK
jgi:hypothetical protein